MQILKKLSIATAGAVVFALGVGGAAQAADFDFSGNFENDNDVIFFDFTVDEDSLVTVFSSSWLYGDAPEGSELGGFDPILSLWDSDGNLIASQDDGHNVGSTLSNGVSYNHGEWDSYYTQSLTTGKYRVSIAQFDNFAVGTTLSEGFRYDGNPNFTYTQGYGGATQPLFNGVWNQTDPNDPYDPRTSSWEFHLLNVNQATVIVRDVPEPTSITGLFAIGALATGCFLKGLTKNRILN